MPSERSHTYMDMATQHHLETEPRGQPRWYYPLFAQPHDHMTTQHHYLFTSRAFYKQPHFSYKQPHSSLFVPAEYIDTHTYPWPGDPNLTMETSSGFVHHLSRPGKLEQVFWRRVNTVMVVAAGITRHLFRYRTTTAHSGMLFLNGVDDVPASC